MLRRLLIAYQSRADRGRRGVRGVPARAGGHAGFGVQPSISYSTCFAHISGLNSVRLNSTWLGSGWALPTLSPRDADGREGMFSGVVSGYVALAGFGKPRVYAG